MRGRLDRLAITCNFIQQQIPEKLEAAVILGSGWGDFVQCLENPIAIPYNEIPNFRRSTAPGHAGQLVCGYLNGKFIGIMQGRFHYYEGYTFDDLVFPIYVLKRLGAMRLIVTNAAGGINPQFKQGDLMLISDHINFMGHNPLRGPNHEDFGPRFPDMSDAYSKAWRETVQKDAVAAGVELQEGVYLGINGPSFETPAEIRFFHMIGADAVGMSTVPEVITGNHAGMKVLGISCISNMAAGMTKDKITAEEVNETTRKVQGKINTLLKLIIAGI